MCVYKLVLGNPDGYASEYSVAIDKMTFVLDPAALFNRKIVIDEIRLEDLKINYETTLTLAESNELDIIKRLDRSTAEEQHALEEAKARNSAFPRTRVPIRPRVRLNRLTVQNIRLLIIPKGFTSGIPLNVTLPEMGPMGTEGDGLTSLALLDRIANEMYTRIYDFAMESKTQIM